MTVVHSIRLRDIGPWVGEHVLDLEALGPGLIAITGPTGCGKSTLLEAVLGGFYLSMPTRQDLPDLASSRRSQVRIEATGDRRLTCRVDVDAQTRKLSAVVLDGETPLNDDGKIASYKRNVAAHFPSQSLYLATEFSAQGGAGGLLRAPRALRRIIFTDLLGHDRLRRLSEAARTHKRDADNRWRTLAAVADKHPTLDRSTAEAKASELEARMLELEQTNAEAVREAERTDAAAAKGREALAESERNDRTRHELESEQIGLANQTESLQAQIDQTDSLLRSSHDVLERGTKLDADRSALQQLVEHGRRLADEAIASDREESARNAEYRDADMAVRRLEQQLEALGVRVSTACARRDSLANADAPPCVGRLPEEAVSSCSMVRSYREERAECSRSISDLASERSRIAQQLDTAYASRESLSVRRAETARHAGDCRQALEASRDAYRRLKEIVDATVDGREALRGAEARRLLLNDQLGTLKSRMRAITRRLLEIPNVQVDMSQLEQAEAEARTAALALKKVSDDILGVATEASAVRATLKAYEEASDRIEQVRVDMRVAAADADEWGQLARGLGPEGVQALMLDAAGPAVSAIACSLLATAWGDRWAVRIDTTRAADDGRTLEDLDITVFDAVTNKTVPIEALSGGQAVVVGEAVSMAMATYRADASGSPIGTMFRDEAAGGLDAETAERYGRMLRSFLETGVEQMVFVAHNPRLWELADHVVDVGHGTIEVLR